MAGVSHDEMVNDFNFQKLPGADQITGDLDVRLAWSGVAAGMVVLCNAPSYVQLPIVGADITPVFRREDGLWMRMSHPSPAVLSAEFAR